MYREDFDLLRPPPRYRDYFDRDRYEERERPLRSYSPPPLDDPYYRSSRREDPLLSLLPPPPRPKDRPFRDRVTAGSYVQGSVTLTPPPIFQSKAPLREKPPNCNTVFVGTLPEGTTEKHLYDIFCECGPIQDVRIARNKTFGHVEFKYESSVDKAILLNRYTIHISTPSGEESSAIQVDFAQSRELSEAKRRMKSGDLLPFNVSNAQIIATDLRNDDTFEFAAKNLVQWMEKGNCTSTTAGTFFGLLSSVNNQAFKLEKDMKAKDREEDEFLIRKRNYLQQLLSQCNTLESVFDTALIKKAWDNFTKPQRKTLSQWKDHVKEVYTAIKTDMESSTKKGEAAADEGPAAKKTKIDNGESSAEVAELESKLARAEQEIEQLKVDHEVAMEKKEKQILQLKTLLARFKKNCPDEWEKIVVGTGGNIAGQQEATEQQVTQEELVVKEDSTGIKEEIVDDDGEWEVVDGVSMDDLNRALDNGSVAGDSLAAAAAAYAQIRTQMGPEETGLGENEIALASVMATFLTVHPLGATLDEIELYFRTFNPNYNSIYLESLLHRLPMVFQLSQAADGQPKWWFMGFQTVSVPVYRSEAPPTEGGNQTVEMVDATSGNSTS